MKLEERFARQSIPVAVIGLGYVGLPLAVEFARAGFTVYGIDVNKKRVATLSRGRSHIQDVPSSVLGPLVREKRVIPTSDYSVIKKSGAVCLCVPTPLNKTGDPDVSYIVTASEQVARYLHRDLLVVLESTTYPGTTDELIQPLLEKSGLKVGKDFFLAFSPERVDPGNESFHTGNIPKVVGGVTPRCTRVAAVLYSQTLEKVIPVSSTKVAEMVKLLENTFRSVNIGLVNETTLLCDRLGIDVWEVIEAAATKPFGYMPFYPGPGLGGHCIPVDPFYLSWKARTAGFEARFIELAGRVNSEMPAHVVRRIMQGLNQRKKSVKGSRVLVLGVAYKADIDDTRESPALDVMELLLEMGARIEYSDPMVPTLRFLDRTMKSQPLSAAVLRRADCVVLTTAHKSFDYAAIYRNAKLIVDTRNAFGNRRGRKLIRL
jgi:UDP-N-acetyl-D-glucosamine dehydrogenase